MLLLQSFVGQALQWTIILRDLRRSGFKGTNWDGGGYLSHWLVWLVGLYIFGPICAVENDTWFNGKSIKIAEQKKN